MKNSLLNLLVFLGLTAGSIMARADMPATHGMLLFGDKATYASHLPMFHAPHAYQLVMKIALANYPRSVTLTYYEQAKMGGQTLFTLVPEQLDLVQITNGIVTSFNANLYSGHFEQGGKSLGPVKVKVEKVILSKKLIPEEIEDALNYTVFGENGEYYAAHLIKGKPSFDAIIKVTQAQTSTLGGCSNRLCDEPFKKSPVLDQTLPVIVSSPIKGQTTLPKKGYSLGNLNSYFTKIEDVLYLEVDELTH